MNPRAIAGIHQVFVFDVQLFSERINPNGHSGALLLAKVAAVADLGEVIADFSDERLTPAQRLPTCV